MYWQLTKDFFSRREVVYFLLFSLICYILFISLSMFSDLDLHKRKMKDKKNKIKLDSQKQKQVSKSEV